MVWISSSSEFRLLLFHTSFKIAVTESQRSQFARCLNTWTVKHFTFTEEGWLVRPDVRGETSPRTSGAVSRFRYHALAVVQRFPEPFSNF
jgi:hypothetical protein